MEKATKSGTALQDNKQEKSIQTDFFPTREENPFLHPAQHTQNPFLGESKSTNPFLGSAQKANPPLQTKKNTGLIQRQSSATQRDRVRLANMILGMGGLNPVVRVLNALGFEISGAAVGFRESASADVGVGAGIGIDEMLMLDLANMQLTGDIVPFGELGVGVKAGWSVGLVIGIRISPRGNYGSIQGAYAGPALNASLSALAGLGFSISPGLFSGNEGFVATCISLGGEAGFDFSVSYALSSAEIVQSLGESLRSGVQSVAQGIASVTGALQSVGEFTQETLGQIVVLPVLIARAKVDPINWDLSRMPMRARQHLQAIGLYLNHELGSDTADRFLTNINKPLRDYRIPPILLQELAQDITQTIQARGGFFGGIVFTPETFLRQNPLTLVELLEGYGLLRFQRSPEAIAQEQLRSARGRTSRP
ncbi:MAG: hypothetical protein OHK0053_26070 [Microscillaceae bacterium]